MSLRRYGLFDRFKVKNFAVLVFGIIYPVYHTYLVTNVCRSTFSRVRL